MKKTILMLLISLFTTNCFADYARFCGDIRKIYTWANGDDVYGIWVDYYKNPSSCIEGFYLSQHGNNTDKVYSFLLAAKAANIPMCIQVDLEYKKSQRCKINYVVNQ